jgi:ribosomal protein L24
MAQSLQGKKVIIIRGPYTGRHGHVSNVRQDKCFVGVSALNKQIHVSKNDLVLADPPRVGAGGGAGLGGGAAGAARVPAFQVAVNRTYDRTVAAAAAAAEETGAALSTPQLTGDRTPMVIDSTDQDAGDDDPWDPNAAETEAVAWAYLGVVATVDGLGDDRFVLCEDATAKFDDERVLIKLQQHSAQATAGGRARLVELLKLHAVTPDGNGPVIAISGARAGKTGTIAAFNATSLHQAVALTDGGGTVSLPLGELAVYDAANSSR